LKIAQYLYVWFNAGAQQLTCVQCKCDLSFHPKKSKVPPLVVTRKTKPYCMLCAWKLNIVQQIGVVYNELNKTGRMDLTKNSREFDQHAQ
jgi:hypothetical protein